MSGGGKVVMNDIISRQERVTFLACDYFRSRRRSERASESSYEGRPSVELFCSCQELDNVVGRYDFEDP